VGNLTLNEKLRSWRGAAADAETHPTMQISRLPSANADADRFPDLREEDVGGTDHNRTDGREGGRNHQAKPLTGSIAERSTR
jgi:hypothetical protein